MVMMIKTLMDQDDDRDVGSDDLNDVEMINFPTFVGDSFDCSNIHQYNHIGLGRGCKFNGVLVDYDHHQDNNIE